MFKSVYQKSVVETVREQIRALVLEGVLVPGSRLPAEKELILQLGVSRPALREALHTLAGEGLLEIRHGRGTYVREPTSASAIQADVISLLLVSKDLREIQEVRRILEPEIIARVAERATEESLAAANEVLDQMEKAVGAGQSVFELAWEFHRRLAQLAGNSAMAKILDVVYEMIRAAQQRLYDRHFDPWQEVQDHRELLDVIRTGDPDQARSAMEGHLDSVDERLNSAFAAVRQVATEKRSSVAAP